MAADCDQRPIETLHLCISGFTQTGDRMSGLLKLWGQLGRFRAPWTLVEYREWNTDWAKFAENLWLTSSEKVRVLVYGYSWGAGYGFLQLARELDFRGLKVAAAVLSDPVYRHPYWVGQWRAFWPYSQIEVPPNVAEVWSFKAGAGLIRAHKVRAAEPTKTKIHQQFRLFGRHHAWMDDAPEFHTTAMRIAWNAENGRIDQALKTVPMPPFAQIHKPEK